MTHDSSNSPTDNPPTGSGLPPLPGADREAPSSGLPPLPPLPSPERKESDDNLPPLPPLPQGSLPPLPADGPSAGAETVPENIIHVQPSGLSAGPQEMEAFPPASEALQLTAEQDFILTLSPAELHTLCEGASFIPAAVAMADGDVDDQERAAFEISDAKFEELFVSGNEAVDAQFNDRFAEAISQADDQNAFGEKIANAKSDEEANRWITFFMADLSRVLERAPDPVRQKIVDHVRESCLAVGEASGDGAGANICGHEAAAITELLALIGVDLDEDTHSRIFSSLEEQSQTEASKQHLEDQFNEVQKSFFALSDDDFSTLFSGILLSMAVGGSDSEWDDLEIAALGRVLKEFKRLGLYNSDKTGIAEVDEWYVQLLKERTKLSIDERQPEIFKIVGCLSDGETGSAVELLDSLLEKFRVLMEKLPAEISLEARGMIMESCLEVALASGDGPGRKISRVEAQMMERIFDALDIQLDEETQAKIASSLAALEEKEKAQEEAAQEVQTEGTEPTGPNPNVEFLQSLSGEEIGDLFTSVMLPPHLVAAADGRLDLEEFQAVDEAGSSLELVFDELIGDVDLETLFEFHESFQLGLNKVVEIGPQLQKSSAVELDRWITNLLDKTQAVFDRSPSDFQDAFKTWIHDACVSVAEASGGEGDDDVNPISIEERQVIRNVFERLGIEVESKFLRTRLNLDQENQDFASYLESLNHDEKIRLLALPHVLVEIVAAADGKIDSQEAMQIVPILKEESAAIDAEFPMIWRENLKEVQQFGKGLSAEFQSHQGSPRKQLEWVFSLLDGYWKILDTMPLELQGKFKTAIANIVTRIAEVAGEGNSAASNIGVEEQLLIDIIHESLGIQSCN